MHLSNFLVTLAALAPLASATGKAIVKNNCKDPVYLWSVGGSVGPKQTIKPGESYSEVFRRDPASGGISLKITTGENGLYDGSPQMNFAYTLDGNRVWYDLSDVFGDPFAGTTASVKPSDGSCRSICWANGVSPGGSQVKDCQANSDETLTLCANGC
ncbi:hypothetical protein EYZ11_010722 [Aspergillus tanneri]|uniref:BYS1 domain protein n=1 Tax=Aspergillus tanneri TaxID=1220188 RepID=A0A4S3J4K8_9EURO|nr:uncharacterized protein ATNIH1004_009623 [Aspergillus tanneri]KAA8642868.1 hypothetical protein ATNIH1004_009623 [Aspergillus tanneri]THC89813.1 hypothetical protein EYZ11_010722 [Aspergillus tanneri]